MRVSTKSNKVHKTYFFQSGEYSDVTFLHLNIKHTVQHCKKLQVAKYTAMRNIRLQISLRRIFVLWCWDRCSSRKSWRSFQEILSTVDTFSALHGNLIVLSFIESISYSSHKLEYGICLIYYHFQICNLCKIKQSVAPKFVFWMGYDNYIFNKELYVFKDCNQNANIVCYMNVTAYKL